MNARVYLNPPIELPDDEAHFQRCMLLWIEWMHTRSNRQGFSSRDSVCGGAMSNYMTASDDSDLVYEASDKKIAQAVQACMESLFNFEHNAVLCHYGIARVWLFPQYEQARCLATGMKRLRELVAQRC